MIIHKTSLDGVLRIQPPTVFRDHRGSYVELYNEDLYMNMGIKLKFVQDDVSVSHKNVLRGIHGDHKTWKLISCLYGSFYLVVVNYDISSAQYCLWEHFLLHEHNKTQILIPPSFGNGHLVISDRAVFHYKQTTYYDRDSQFTLKWNDERLKIPWGIKDPILSDRDR